MARFTIELTADVPNQTIQTSMDGVIYTIRFHFNRRDGFWYLSILDEQELVTYAPAGERLVLNWPMYLELLPGFLYATLTGGLERRPADLTNMVFTYYDRESREAIRLGTEFLDL